VPITSAAAPKALGHDESNAGKVRRPYSKGQKNDFQDAEAIAEAVRRPTMKFVATNPSISSTAGVAPRA
jgi:hypothetical protein